MKRYLGGWMRMVSNAVTNGFNEKLAKHNLSIAEWFVLRVLYEAKVPQYPSDLARQTGLSRGAVSKLVEKARAKGLLVRSESTADRRFQEIALTNKGKTLVPKLKTLAQQNDDDFFSCLTKSERLTLDRTLKKVVEQNPITQWPFD